MLQGDGGYSKKSERNQASYYYSQPFFEVSGRLTIDDRHVTVTGQAWMDREWSSQPLAPDQTGWDWFALHLAGGEKLMLYRMRQKDGRNYASGTWILPDATTRQLAPADIQMTPKAPIDIEGHKLPVAMADRHSLPQPCDRNDAAQSKSLDGYELCLLGRPDHLSRQPRRRGLSGADRLLIHPAHPGL